MAEITGYGNGSWMFGQQVDAFPDKTLSQKKWDAYLREIDAIQEELRRQVKEEGEMNLQVADQGREKRREIWQEEWERFVVFSKANLERAAQADQADRDLFAAEVQEETLLNIVNNDGKFDEKFLQILSGDGGKFHFEVRETQQDTGVQEEWFPYDYLSQDGLTITYHGVTFTCSKSDHTISLGDTSNPKDVIRIPLSNGGTLLVNKNHIAELGRAITMFSSEDIGLILRAIAEYQKVSSMEYEMEEDEMDTMERITENSSGVEVEEASSEHGLIGKYEPDSEWASGHSVLEEEEGASRDKK